MRPIDADEVLESIEELKRSPWYNGENGNYERIVRSDAIGTVADLCIKTAPTLDYAPCQHWISVEDRYPEDQQHVLIAYKNSRYVSIGYFDEGFAEWDSLYDNEIVRPDYWMPLPEAPKEEE